MRRLSSTGAAVVAMLLSLACAAHDPGPAGQSPPNLIIILADDLGYGDTGVYGGQRIRTPNIDALAARGVRFSDGYVAAAVCSPSRAALMTGRYPQRFGYHFNDNARPGLPLTETTLATRLKSAGYATGAVGKWQLGWTEEQRPLSRGFDEFFGMAGGSIYIEPGTPGSESWAPPGAALPSTRRRAIYRGNAVVEEKEYLTDAFTREAVDFITRHRDEPFFLYLAHYAPHVPLQATDKYLDRYRHIEDPPTRIFSAMVSALDDSVGAVTKTLDELGIDDNTLIVFLSDNGCALYLGGACSNVPLSGGKRHQLEGGVRVPFIASWPARLPAGEVFSDPVTSIDLAATLLAAAGTEPIPPELDGVDLIPSVLGQRDRPPHDRLFWQAGPNRAVRDGDLKLWQVNRTTEEALARLAPHALIPDYTAPRDSPHGQLTVLYDLATDISESRNLAQEHPDAMNRLLEALDSWDSEMKDSSVDSTRGTRTRIEGAPVELIF